MKSLIIQNKIIEKESQNSSLQILETKNNFTDRFNEEVKRRMRDKSDIMLISNLHF